jgi:hypothetical protein
MTKLRNLGLAFCGVFTMLAAGALSSPAGATPAPYTHSYVEIFNTSQNTPTLQETTVTATQDTTTGTLTVDASGDANGSVTLNVTPPGGQELSPTTVLDTASGLTMTADVAGTQCDATNGIDAQVEVDQVQYSTVAPIEPTTLGIQFAVSCDNGASQFAGAVALNLLPTTPGAGYYIYGDNGELAGFGNDDYLNYLGDLSTIPLNQPVVGMATTGDGGGYWMVASDGGIFSYGDAQFYGSTGNLTLNQPIVGMAATPDDKGYWLVAADGGIFSYGDAQFYGSTGSIALNQPIVGMAATADGRGYWLVASDGGIFAFGDAKFHGSTGNITLNQPIVGMAATTTGDGYWMVASDGGVFSFGDAHFYGSTGNITLNQPIVGLTPTADDGGYWFTAADGGVFAYGDAKFHGSLASLGVTNVVGITH